MNVSANGRSSTVRLPCIPAAVFLPDFDPGASDTLLALAAAQNGRDLWAIVPKQTDGQAGAILPVELATYVDEKGTLDGTPIAVHHLVATIAGEKTDSVFGAGQSAPSGRAPAGRLCLYARGLC